MMALPAAPTEYGSGPDTNGQGMAGRYIALLRAISNVPMAPFRAALEDLGYTGVTSFGMSGNLVFETVPTPAAELERRIGEKLGKVALVRSSRQVATIARADPFAGRRDATVLFLQRPPSPTWRENLLALDIAEPRPVLRGSVLYFAGWVTVAGRRIDLEKALGTGTMRSSGVVARLAQRMS